VTSLAMIRLLQWLGQHALAERLLRLRLRQARGRDGESLHYRLALSLDALGRHAEAAASYAQAMDSALAPVLQAQGVAPRAAASRPSSQRTAY
jgi:hypothetical protein